MNSEAPVEIYFSYAHQDEELRDELERHLILLERQRLAKFWYDRKIQAGELWAPKIQLHLNTAHIILLLISHHYFDSNWCIEIELERAIDRYKAGEARVISILLDLPNLTTQSLENLPVLPTNSKPVVEWKDRNEAFKNISDGIWSAVTSGLPHKF